jgi:predicted acetyltransferase
MSSSEPGVVRLLGPDDARASRRLSWEAFGVPPGADDATTPAPYRAGMSYLGLFSPTDRDALVAQVADRDYESWFGAARVPTSGVAAVSVAAEHRGRGHLAPLFTELLDFARNRGAAISTLFPTAPNIYRGFGFEIVGELTTLEVDTADLAGVRPPAGGLRARRATADDFDAVRGVYDAWAAAQNGPLTRRGVSFPATAEEFLASFTGVTMAVDGAGDARGYASWLRGGDSGATGRLDVVDLVATREDASRLLLRTLGSFASVAPTTTIRTSSFDWLRYLLPTGRWRVETERPYMLRVLDPVAAFGLRRYPRVLEAEVVFGIADEFLTDLDGSWRLRVVDGSATCERTDQAPGPVFTGRGLAASYAGSQGTANLRMSGLLSGDDADDDTWDALLGGRQVHIRDYF